MLFTQSICFYVPHFLWKSCEGRRVERLVSGVLSPTASEDVKRKYRVSIAQYFHFNKTRNSLYGAKFVTCECLNIINCGLQILLIDQLLGGEFTSYGLQGMYTNHPPDETIIDDVQCYSLPGWMMKRELILWSEYFRKSQNALFKTLECQELFNSKHV